MKIVEKFQVSYQNVDLLYELTKSQFIKVDLNFKCLHVKRGKNC